MNFAGVLTMLRVHEKGTGWGPPDDAISTSRSCSPLVAQTSAPSGSSFVRTTTS